MREETYVVTDDSTGETVTFKVTNWGTSTGRASMMEAMIEDLYENWHLSEDVDGNDTGTPVSVRKV